MAVFFEGCPIHPTSVDSSLVFAIWLTGRRFARDLRKYSVPGIYRVGWKYCRFDSIRSNRHESFPLLSIRYTGSRFARDLGNIVAGSIRGRLKMLSIRFDSNESTRIVSLAVDSLLRKSICASLRKYGVPGLYRVGWKCCRFDSIRTNRHESFPLLSIRYTAGSRFERYLENIASQVYTTLFANTSIFSCLLLL